MTHAYPRDLGVFAAERWQGPVSSDGGDYHDSCLPPMPVFEEVLSTCYQASLMREEERPVTFRLILADPRRFPDDDGPPHGFQPLRLSPPRPFGADELRRLAPAADFHRSLISASIGSDSRTEVWGIVSTGPRWIQAAHGGRVRSRPLPDCLVVCVTGPGQLVVCQGSETVATLHAGCVTCPATDVYGSRWLSEAFAAVREELLLLHHSGTAGDPARRPIDPAFISQIGQHVVRRALSVIRAERHGATLLFLSPESSERCEHASLMRIKYRFEDAEPRRRFRALLLRIMDAISAVGSCDERAAGWADYVTSLDERLGELDEAIFEVAHLLADLAAVDGAVVLTKRFEVLGFGAEISGTLPDVAEVDRALDREGSEVAPESATAVGTRHRSVYRLCERIPDLTAIVVSQDGGVRFVKKVNGRVTYWDQASAAGQGL